MDRSDKRHRAIQTTDQGVLMAKVRVQELGLRKQDHGRGKK